MRSDDGGGDGQAQAQAVGLGGEEGLEEPRELGGGDTGTGVGDRHFDGPGIRLSGTHDQASPLGRHFGHGVHAVEDEVEQHLLQMHAVAAHREQHVRDFDAQPHLAARRIRLHQDQDLVDQLRDVELDVFQAPPLEQAPHVIDDLARAVVVPADVGEDGAHLLQVRRTPRQQELGGLRIAQDGPERLVQLVRQTRRQLGHGGHATGMGQLGLQLQHFGFGPLAGGDVDDDGQDERPVVAREPGSARFQRGTPSRPCGGPKASTILDQVRAQEPLAAARTLAESMLRAAYGLNAPPLDERAQLDLRAYESASRLLDELEDWERLGEHLSREEILSALERATVRGSAANEPGRVHVLDLMRARTRRYEIVFVLGLEQGGLPRRSQASPFLDDQARADIDQRKRGARLARPDQVSRERYLFYTACTRASRRVYLVREAATDDGSPREAGPFWDEVRALWPADEVERWTTRRRLSSLTWQLERAPTERERLRSLAALSPVDPQAADAAARANGWERRLERARVAFDRPTRLRHPAVLEELRAKTTFGVTELEAFADCSSIWFIERIVSPRSIDNQPDARLRGSIAHSALHKFFAGLPKALGTDRVEPEQLEDAIAFLHQCLDEALESGLWLELTDVERSELEQGLRRDLEHFVRKDAELGLTFVPRRFEVSFGSERAAPELQAGLDLGDFALSGKIDRIDVDPFSARGIVQDYKSGKTAFSAAKIDSELRLQIPLYMLVLRDLVGIEPLGGLYRALAGERDARGLLREEARDDLPGFVSTDYLDEDEFWQQVETGKERATSLVERIRAGDVEHDPKGRLSLPAVVRAVVDVQGEARVSTAPNTEQLAAIEAPGVVFVSAGAGTGKTTVLVERYVRAVCERGLDIDSILVITYTERAAGELATRIRARLLELGRHDLARSLDGAWISTIHGFCHRLLKAHPFAAGIDPRYRVLDESQARVVQGEAFQQALTEFCRAEDPERLRLLATYGARGLRRMVTGAFETLRSAGRPLELELPGDSELPARVEELRDAARCLLDEGPDDTLAASSSCSTRRRSRKPSSTSPATP